MKQMLIAVALIAVLAGTAMAQDVRPAPTCAGPTIFIHLRDYQWVTYCDAEWAWLPADAPRYLSIRTDTARFDYPIQNIISFSVEPITPPFTRKK